MPKNEAGKEVSHLQKQFANLQSENETVKNQNFNLQKFNSTLQDQVNKYALLLTEEKNERNELLEKYDTLQNTLHQQIQRFTKKYYLLMGIAIVLFVLLLPLLQNWLGA